MNILTAIILVIGILLVVFDLVVVGATMKVSSRASRAEEAVRLKRLSVEVGVNGG